MTSTKYSDYYIIEIHLNLFFQVLASKEAHAQGLKRRLGITAWREFSEDMTQGLKNLQDSQAYKQAGEAVGSAKAKGASVWSSISNSQSFISASQKMGSAFGAAKTKVTTSFSSQNLASYVIHHMFSRILNFLFVFSRKKIVFSIIITVNGWTVKVFTLGSHLGATRKPPCWLPLKCSLFGVNFSNLHYYRVPPGC